MGGACWFGVGTWWSVWSVALWLRREAATCLPPPLLHLHLLLLLPLLLSSPRRRDPYRRWLDCAVEGPRPLLRANAPRASSHLWALLYTEPPCHLVWGRRRMWLGRFKKRRPHPSTAVSPLTNPVDSNCRTMATATAARASRAADGDPEAVVVGAGGSGEPLRAGTPSKDSRGALFGAVGGSGAGAGGDPAAAAASSTAFVICTSIASSVLLIFTNKWVPGGKGAMGWVQFCARGRAAVTTAQPLVCSLPTPSRSSPARPPFRACATYCIAG
jgi:hypothetical protein